MFSPGGYLKIYNIDGLNKFELGYLLCVMIR